MSRSVSIIAQSLSRLCLTRGIHSLHAPTASTYIPSLRIQRIAPVSDSPEHPDAGDRIPTVSYELPALENARRLYTFPTLNRAPISAPAPFLQEILEKMDPLPETERGFLEVIANGRDVERLKKANVKHIGMRLNYCSCRDAFPKTILSTGICAEVHSKRPKMMLAKSNVTKKKREKVKKAREIEAKKRKNMKLKCHRRFKYLPRKASIEAPSWTPPSVIQLAPRLLTIRRKKMKKHKRRKRYDRDFFKYQKYHREKKLKAEREFIRRMKAHLAELESFNPEQYVEETIASAKKEWSSELAPTGRKRYPHWSRLMSLEELYGIPKSDYIDKKAGLAGEEDAAKIKQLKTEYDNKYRGN